MEFRRLGTTDLQVSALGLGTMTWGEQNSEAEAHAQLDFGLERGINLIDAAEMYPVPPKPETTGLTETYIGTWLKRRPSNRDKIVLATKVAGRSEMVWVRGATDLKQTRLDRAQITQALDQSLKRLATDHVDLYQVHWPERSTNHFGRLDFPGAAIDDCVPIAETLSVLGDLQRAGKIRHIGVSNETPWGVMQYLRAHEAQGLPRIVSIQNAYSLVNRVFEIGLAEVAAREHVGLIAYSSLAMGHLTGKYRHGARPEGSRLALFTRFQRYSSPENAAAVERYLQLAEQVGLAPAKMALSFAMSRPFTTSVLLGATSLKQLEEDFDAHLLKLDPAVLAEIDAIHKSQPNPAP